VKVFSYEEKKQKTFMFRATPTIEAMASLVGAHGEAKVFWFFFSKKNILASLIDGICVPCYRYRHCNLSREGVSIPFAGWHPSGLPR
jgi:hypothetical protein